MSGIFIKSNINLFTIYDMIFYHCQTSYSYIYVYIFCISQHSVHDMMEAEVFKNESKCQPKKHTASRSSHTHTHSFPRSQEAKHKKCDQVFVQWFLLPSDADYCIFLTAFGFVPRIQLKFCVNVYPKWGVWADVSFSALSLDMFASSFSHS